MAEAPTRPRLVVVDGYNLLHAISRFAPRGRDVAAARAALEDWLRGEALRRRVDVLLIWDGGGTAAGRRHGPLRVEGTPAGKTADARILDVAREQDSPAGVWIVSSDADVREPARQLGFTVLGAMTFYRRWTAVDDRASLRRRGPGSGGPGGRRAGADGETKPSPTRRDVERMLDELLNGRGGDVSG